MNETSNVAVSKILTVSLGNSYASGFWTSYALYSRNRLQTIPKRGVYKIPWCWNVGPAIADVRGLRRAAVTSHLYPHFTAIQHITIQLIHCLFWVTSVKKTNESEASGLFGESIPRYVYITHFTIALKYWLELLWTDSVGEVIHFQTYHATNIGRSPPPVRVPAPPRAASVPAPTSTLVSPAAPAPTPVSVPVLVPASASITAHSWEKAKRFLPKS